MSCSQQTLFVFVTWYSSSVSIIGFILITWELRRDSKTTFALPDVNRVVRSQGWGNLVTARWCSNAAGEISFSSGIYLVVSLDARLHADVRHIWHMHVGMWTPSYLCTRDLLAPQIHERWVEQTLSAAAGRQAQLRSWPPGPQNLVDDTPAAGPQAHPEIKPHHPHQKG